MPYPQSVEVKAHMNHFLRENILIFSIIGLVLGILASSMGVLWILLPNIATTLTLLNQINDLNYCILLLGIILLFAGIYYLYSYYKNKTFLQEELTAERRSDFIKKHKELKAAARNLPCKYQDMLKEAEERFNYK